MDADENNLNGSRQRKTISKLILLDENGGGLFLFAEEWGPPGNWPVLALMGIKRLILCLYFILHNTLLYCTSLHCAAGLWISLKYWAVMKCGYCSVFSMKTHPFNSELHTSYLGWGTVKY